MKPCGVLDWDPWQQVLSQRIAFKRCISECSVRYFCRRSEWAEWGLVCLQSHLRSEPTRHGALELGRLFRVVPKWNKGSRCLYSWISPLLAMRHSLGRGYNPGQSSFLHSKDSSLWGLQLWAVRSGHPSLQGRELLPWKEDLGRAPDQSPRAQSIEEEKCKVLREIRKKEKGDTQLGVG